jgi:hypothetical protein
LPCRAAEITSGHLQEFSNREEAELVVSIVQGFLAAGAAARDVVVLSPFVSQLELVKRLPEARGEALLNKAVFEIGNTAEVPLASASSNSRSFLRLCCLVSCKGTLQRHEIWWTFHRSHRSSNPVMGFQKRGESCL